MMADLPTVYKIKAEDLPLFGKKTWKIFMLGKFSDILSAGDTEWAYFSVSTSPNSTEITKLVLNNNTFISILFAVTSIVRKKRNFKINRESGWFKKKRPKSGRSSVLSEDLADLWWYCWCQLKYLGVVHNCHHFHERTQRTLFWDPLPLPKAYF